MSCETESISKEVRDLFEEANKVPYGDPYFHNGRYTDLPICDLAIGPAGDIVAVYKPLNPESRFE